MGAADATGFQNDDVVAGVVDEVNVVPPKMEGVLVADAADVVVAPKIVDTFVPAPAVDCPNKDGADTGAVVVVAAAWPNVDGTDAVVVVVVATVCCAPKDNGAVDDATVTCGMLKACGTGAGEASEVVVGA